MRTIDIGIGHDNNLVIPQFANIIIIGANTRSKAVTIVLISSFCSILSKRLSPRSIPCRAGQNGLILPVLPAWQSRRRNHLPPDIFHSMPDLFLTIGKFAGSAPILMRFCGGLIPWHVWPLPWLAPPPYIYSVLFSDRWIFLQVTANFS